MRCIFQGFSASSKVAFESCSCWLYSISCSDNHCSISDIFTKIWIQRSLHLFCNRHIYICIQHVTWVSLKIIEGSNHQSYSNCFSRHDTGIHNGSWCLDHVASCHKPDLLHFDIKYHVALHKLVAYECFFPSGKISVPLWDSLVL